MGSKELNMLTSAAVAVGGMAAIVLTSLAVISGYKDTGAVSNDTADKFVAGIAIFATFVAVIILAIVGKAIYGMFKD